jgi:ribosomal protein S18 acetylase RimI-like enzyme
MVGPGHEFDRRLLMGRRGSHPKEFVDAQVSDSNEIARVFIAARRGMTYLPGSPYTEQETVNFFRGLIEDRENAVLEAIGEGGEIAGFAVFGKGRVDHLYVHPAHQRRGIGSRLLKAAQERYAHLEGWVFEKNTDALKLYDRHGFRVVERTDGSRNEEHEPDIRIAWSRPGS